MQNELFGKKNPKTSKQNTPLAARLIAKNIDDVIGQDHILAKDKLLYRLIESDSLRSALFFGSPGTGKTALAKFIASKTNAFVYQLNAVIAGVAELKKIIEKSNELKDLYGKDKVLLILDEIHHFNRSQQDILLPSVEQGDIILIGITTENPFFYINRALLSRFAVFEFKPLSEKSLSKILSNALERIKKETEYPQVEFTDDAEKFLVTRCEGDARKLLNALELGLLTIKPKKNKIIIDKKTAGELTQMRSISYDKSQDEHYDHISAFIKSMRGSDPDASVYWLAKMITAGEDPRFIARRILICASEDVGNADPVALILAQSAFNAVEVLGMPESRIILSQAAIYVACAPKSNSVYKAVDAAIAEVKNGVSRKVPEHLKSGMRNEGYVYPHDYPDHYVKQQYMSEPKKFYNPSEQGKEAQVKAKFEKLKQKK
ncbi:MAG TPA: replication-associated recombination protein A [Elusimicrobiales bacterium]|nr:replication-associated recombination protein A [Elusimicrobiales bacterium]